MAFAFWKRSREWMKGQPKSWPSDWLKGVLSYVLGQKKVQGSRPKSGAPMHLMIFYGFLSLLLATTLLAIATYAPLIGLENFHKGTYYLVFEATFDILGLLLLVGVCWAGVRRFLYLKKQGKQLEDAPEKVAGPLGHDPRDWEALGLLLVLTVTGYVLEGARISSAPTDYDIFSPVGYGFAQIMGGVSPGAYAFIWWFHMLWVWVFFVRLPHLKLKHAVTATLTASGKEETPMGRLQPITMEEVEATGKIGVTAATDYSRWNLLALDACMTCGRCTEVCPANKAGKVLNPRKVVADIAGAVSSGASVAEAVSEEALWACTTCHACVEACPVLIPHVEMIVDARRGLIAEGKLSGTGAVMLRQVASTDHAWGSDRGTREDWMKGLDVPLCRDGVEFEYLFWVGCAGATDPGAVKTTKAVASLLRKAGVSFACLGVEEACTGDPARRTGDEFLFQEQVGKNQSFFEKYGVNKIVTACPHCLNTLRNEYPDFMERVEVFHHTQLLNQLVDAGLLKGAKSEPGKTTLHDPCYLARVNDESDAPRSLLGDETHMNGADAALVHKFTKPADGTRNLAEPEHHGRKTLCCGAGGGRMWMEEEPDQRPSQRRVQELLDTGAEEIAVACPFCRIMLDAGVKQETDEPIRLVDIAEKLQEANNE